MSSLTDKGSGLFAGPLAGSENGRVRILLIAEAASAADVRHHLFYDPWETSQQLVTTSIEPWNLLVGEARLLATPPAENLRRSPASDISLGAPPDIVEAIKGVPRSRFSCGTSRCR